MTLLNRGINLKIDSSITHICEISNKSSSQTRAVMYLVLIASFIQIAVILNTFSHSWHRIKHEKELKSIESSINQLKYTISSNSSPAAHHTEELKYLQQKRLQVERYDVENFKMVRLPIVNIPIHVNDTGLLSGLLLCVLFTILVFTLEREETNLCLALNAITNRYSDDSDKEAFDTIISSEDNEENKVKLLNEINHTRRSYHYNLLTMNELFTKPNISINVTKGDEPEHKTKTILLNNKYMFSVFIFLLTFIHDIATRSYGYNYSIDRTLLHLIIMVIALAALLMLNFKCSKLTRSILIRYNKFKSNDYKFVSESHANV